MSALLRRPGALQRGGRPELDGIREDRPIVDVLLPAEIGFRSPNRFRQRRSLDGERGLTGAMLVPRVVADCLDKAHIV